MKNNTDLITPDMIPEPSHPSYKLLSEFFPPDNAAATVRSIPSGILLQRQLPERHKAITRDAIVPYLPSFSVKERPTGLIVSGTTQAGGDIGIWLNPHYYFGLFLRVRLLEVADDLIGKNVDETWQYITATTHTDTLHMLVTSGNSLETTHNFIRIFMDLLPLLCAHLGYTWHQDVYEYLMHSVDAAVERKVSNR